MKAALVLAVLGALVAVATGDVSMFDSNPTQQSALTTIDSVPTRAQLQAHDLVMPDDLITIAENVDDTFEPAVRLRALHGLAVYCTTTGITCDDTSAAHAALAKVIADNASARTGADLLVLRAAIESIGPLQDIQDLGALTSLLNHSSRDIRAASARAIAALQKQGCPAINDLRVRYQTESTEQVRLVISETLRILSQTCGA